MTTEKEKGSSREGKMELVSWLKKLLPRRPPVKFLKTPSRKGGCTRKKGEFESALGEE